MKKQTETNKSEVLLYKNRVEVHLDKETVWLTQLQMAGLFGTKRPAITKHLANIFSAGELRQSSVSSKMEHTATDGKVYKTQCYNLDVIISVGYRVNSTQATRFRIWATQVLRKHLVEGYTLNEKRLKLAEIKYQELQKAIALIGNVAAVDGLSSEVKGIAQVIAEYSRALDLLDDFDHERLAKPPGTKKSSYELTYAEARKIIELEHKASLEKQQLYEQDKLRVEYEKRMAEMQKQLEMTQKAVEDANRKANQGSMQIQ